ncbi:MAG: shikimate kinase [Candidatus Borkfalkiaceae bacterium]|nr:shikimate kinase [bacterium]MDY2850881.1 shikimate kinase [Christensenellaceae bacterium]
MMETKEEIRERIDAIDEKIASLLSERFSLTDKIGKIKEKNYQKISDRTREEQVIGKVKGVCSRYGGVIGVRSEVEAVYEKIFELSKSRQEIFGKKFALVGGKLSHSYSQPLHEAFGYNYELIETTEDKLEGLLRSDKYDGFNVTVPFKRLAASYCDVLDETASMTGTVNVVVKRNGVLYGYNTDYFGMEYALKKADIEIKDKNVLIAGTGGTAHTAKLLCENLGARSVCFVGRNYETNYYNCYEKKETQVLINATPVGMYPDTDKTVLSVERFSKLESVFDAVYNPYKTKLILGATVSGKKAACGFEMLVAQAVKSAEIFLGRNFDVGTIEAASRVLKLKKLNIVFAGMPGAGKTTLGREFAKKFGLKFLDTDEEFEKSYGISAEDYIIRFGEKEFRSEEKKLLLSILKSQDNACIALGGGSLSDNEVIAEVCKKSFVVIIERSIDKLERGGRPLSSSREDLVRIYEKRMPIFREIGDLFVNNDATVDDAVKKLSEGI